MTLTNTNRHRQTSTDTHTHISIQTDGQVELTDRQIRMDGRTADERTGGRLSERKDYRTIWQASR